MILYHGSDVVVERPLFGFGKDDNDYGSGFYTTEDEEKAKEWACVNGKEDCAVCNKYELDTTDLNILNLDEYGIFSWIAEIVTHRGVANDDSVEMGEMFVRKYKIDTSQADVIIGYRADDSYISVVEAFLNNQLSVDEVERQFRKGSLGEQVFIKSPKAFDAIKFIGYEKVIPSAEYGEAENRARQEVTKFLTSRRKAIAYEKFSPNGITVVDAVKNRFVYDKEYNYYYPEENDNVSPVQNKKGRNNYERI